MSWQPLLDGADAERAWRAIAGVADALAAPAEDATLDEGAAGRALFFAYLDRARGGYAAASRRALDAARDGIAALSDRPGLLAGFTGVAWTVEHLDGDGDDDANDELDEILLELIASWTRQYDLVSGLCGFGLYALSRVRRASGPRLVAAVVDKLAASARRDAGGAHWWTPPEWLHPDARPLSPDGHCNLGLAHGTPAAALVLAAAAQLGDTRARPLALEATRFILTPRLAAGTAFLPSLAGEDKPARAAWCYGDPGAAAALVAATDALGDAAWIERARALARLAAARPAAECDVLDAGICHGAVGLALIFHQLHHATGEGLFAAAARRWYAATLDYARADVAGGFTSARLEGDAIVQREDLSLGGGACGVGLALLAAVTPIAPRWIATLGLALP